MFFNISVTAWKVMMICSLIALAYPMLLEAIKGETVRFTQKNTAVLLCTVIAILSTILSKAQSFVGAPMIGLMIGIILVNVVPDNLLGKEFRSGTTFAGKKYLSMGIVCLGATLVFTDLFSAAYALPLILFNMALSFGIAYLVGRKAFHVSDNICALVGSGTCVCGGTAIAAISPVIKAKEEETAYAMTSIFLFDLLACLSYPYLAMQFGMSEYAFGFLAGTAINDTSSVVAAQETFASLAGLEGYALPATIKVVRTTMIIVLALVFSVLTIKKDSASQQTGGSLGKTVWNAIPKFILVFLVMITLNTVLKGGASDSTFYKVYFNPFFANSYKFFVTIALAGVGFKIKFKDLFTKGLRPILLGGCTWIGVFLSSLIFSTVLI